MREREIVREETGGVGEIDSEIDGEIDSGIDGNIDCDIDGEIACEIERGSILRSTE